MKSILPGSDPGRKGENRTQRLVDGVARIHNRICLDITIPPSEPILPTATRAGLECSLDYPGGPLLFHRITGRLLLQRMTTNKSWEVAEQAYVESALTPGLSLIDPCSTA